MIRRGKIARLPRDIREELNRRIQNGEPGTDLVTWLNSLQEVNDVLKTQFDSQPINAQNLSDWNDGGYRDWLLQQEAVDLIHLMQDNGEELTQAANNTRLSELLAQRLVARIVLLAQRLDQSAADGPPDPKLLREMCSDVVALRRGDLGVERLKLARDRLGLERRELTPDQLETLAKKWAKEHNYGSILMTDEERDKRYREILGLDDQSVPSPRHMRQRPGQDPAATPSATIKQPEGPPSAESPADPTESNQ